MGYRFSHVLTSFEPVSENTFNASTIAVIGASGGLGSELVRQLQSFGARVVLAGPHTEKLEPLAHTSDRVIPFDLRDSTAGDLLVRTAVELGGLDGVINAAGVVAFGPLAELDDVDLEEMFLINVLGPLWMMKRVTPLLAESKGWLCSISGVIAETPLPNMAAYAATKASISAASRSLFRELRRQHVFVCDARPPHTETGLASRPLSGTAPAFPVGLHPSRVAARILLGIEQRSPELSGTDFSRAPAGEMVLLEDSD